MSGYPASEVGVSSSVPASATVDPLHTHQTVRVADTTAMLALTDTDIQKDDIIELDDGTQYRFNGPAGGQATIGNYTNMEDFATQAELSAAESALDARLDVLETPSLLTPVFVVANEAANNSTLIFNHTVPSGVGVANVKVYADGNVVTDAGMASVSLTSATNIRVTFVAGYEPQSEVKIEYTYGGAKGDAGANGTTPWAATAAWVTATSYSASSPASIVTQGGSTYQCIVSHTSGTFATDLAANKWLLLAQKGSDGSSGTPYTEETMDLTSGGTIEFAMDISGKSRLEFFTHDLVDNSTPGIVLQFGSGATWYNGLSDYTYQIVRGTGSSASAVGSTSNGLFLSLGDGNSDHIQSEITFDLTNTRVIGIENKTFTLSGAYYMDVRAWFLTTASHVTKVRTRNVGGNPSSGTLTMRAYV